MPGLWSEMAAEPHDLRWQEDGRRLTVLVAFLVAAGTNLAQAAFSPIVRLASGAPFNIGLGADRNLDDISNDRPGFTANTSALKWREPGQPLDASILSQFTLPTIGQTGNLPRNALLSPAFNDTDLSIIKNVRLAGQARLQLRVEAFNVFNQANFGQPGRIATVVTSSFGVITNTRFPTGDSGSARQVQFAIKFLF